MRPVRIYLAAAGVSAWVPVDYIQSQFGIGFRCTVEEGATLTYKVQHGFTDLLTVNAITMSRVTTTGTMTWPVTTENPTHGLSVGDCIINSGYGAPFDGVFTLATVASPTVATFTVANSGPTSSNAGQTQRVFVGDHTEVVNETTSQDGNYAFPINMMRLNCTAWTDGAVTMSINQGLGGA